MDTDYLTLFFNRFKLKCFTFDKPSSYGEADYKVNTKDITTEYTKQYTKVCGKMLTDITLNDDTFKGEYEFNLTETKLILRYDNEDLNILIIFNLNIDIFEYSSTVNNFYKNLFNYICKGTIFKEENSFIKIFTHNLFIEKIHIFGKNDTKIQYSKLKDTLINLLDELIGNEKGFLENNPKMMRGVLLTSTCDNKPIVEILNKGDEYDRIIFNEPNYLFNEKEKDGDNIYLQLICKEK